MQRRRRCATAARLLCLVLNAPTKFATRGDHLIFLGPVSSVFGDADRPPLVYHAGGYRRLSQGERRRYRAARHGKLNARPLGLRMRSPRLQLPRRTERASYNGNTLASQARAVGSIPIARSTPLSFLSSLRPERIVARGAGASLCVPGDPPGLGGIFSVWAGAGPVVIQVSVRQTVTRRG